MRVTKQVRDAIPTAHYPCAQCSARIYDGPLFRATDLYWVPNTKKPGFYCIGCINTMPGRQKQELSLQTVFERTEKLAKKKEKDKEEDEDTVS